jgi:hypothetical protein
LEAEISQHDTNAVLQILGETPVKTSKCWTLHYFCRSIFERIAFMHLLIMLMIICYNYVLSINVYIYAYLISMDIKKFVWFRIRYIEPHDWSNSLTKFSSIFVCYDV